MAMATASRSLFAQVESALRSKSSEAGIVVYDFESGRVLALRDPDLLAETALCLSRNAECSGAEEGTSGNAYLSE